MKFHFLETSVPWLTVESVFSLYKWKQDEHQFFTLSYLHAGCDKFWYVIPATLSRKAHRLIEVAEKEKRFLTPEDMLGEDIDVLCCVQKEGQYVIVEPGSYYCTLSTGYSLSESVKFAPMDWFKKLENMEIKLNDYVKIRMVLNYISELTKSNKYMKKDVLIRKLDTINLLLSNSLSRLQDAGVTNVRYLKSMPKEADICYTCDASCYLVSVTFEEDEDDDSNKEYDIFCLDHALGLIESKKFKCTDAKAYVFLTTNKVNQLISKLKAK